MGHSDVRHVSRIGRIFATRAAPPPVSGRRSSNETRWGTLQSLVPTPTPTPQNDDPPIETRCRNLRVPGNFSLDFHRYRSPNSVGGVPHDQSRSPVLGVTANRVFFFFFSNDKPNNVVDTGNLCVCSVQCVCRFHRVTRWRPAITRGTQSCA